MREELIRILRNPKWKYLLLVALLGYGYYAITFNDLDSSSAYGFSMMNHEELLISKIMVPVFCYLYLLYHIAKEEEPTQPWKMLLAFPCSQRQRLIMKTLVLLLFQIPIFFFAQGLYLLIMHTVSLHMLLFCLGMQSLYLLGFLYYRMVIASGYLNQMGSVKIINVLEYLLPIFLGTCILNAADWIFIFHRFWMVLLLFELLAYLILCISINHLMQRKLFRELVLYKLFGTITSPQSAMVLRPYKGIFDKGLQLLFQKFDRHSKHYWALCAAIEVCLKQNMFYLLVAILCFIVGFTSQLLIVILAGIYCCILILYSFHREKGAIQHMRIK